jgi:hypothetical protein
VFIKKLGYVDARVIVSNKKLLDLVLMLKKIAERRFFINNCNYLNYVNFYLFIIISSDVRFRVP